jgi:hypothetical protein
LPEQKAISPLVTVIVATIGDPGDANPEPAALTHPFNVWVTLYVPAILTVITGAVIPLLHNKLPVNPLAVNVDVPSQLFITVTIGDDGIAFTVTETIADGDDSQLPLLTVT